MAAQRVLMKSKTHPPPLKCAFIQAPLLKWTGRVTEMGFCSKRIPLFVVHLIDAQFARAHHRYTH